MFSYHFFYELAEPCSLSSHNKIIVIISITKERISVFLSLFPSGRSQKSIRIVLISYHKSEGQFHSIPNSKNHGVTIMKQQYHVLLLLILSQFILVYHETANSSFLFCRRNDTILLAIRKYQNSAFFILFSTKQ